MNVLSIVGARPQFIKAAVVSDALRSTGRVSERILHTGQHYDSLLSEVFFRELDIPSPLIELGVGSGPHGLQTGRMLEGVEKVLTHDSPDWVLVYGDTNSTLAGALAAAKLHIPVAHIEAGLRSFDRNMPEEINRVLTDHVSEICFAPTETAIRNLLREGISERGIAHAGDVMYDVTLRFGEKAEERSTILHDQELTPGAYVLATVHRAENTDDRQRLSAILGGLAIVAQELPVLLPIHPRTAAAIAAEPGLNQLRGAVRTIPPLGYFDMVTLERNAALVATDSGGVQKEAFFHRVPCVTLRETTEWTELVELGWNKLVPPTSPSDVAAGVRGRIGSHGNEGTPYGDGHAAEAITKVLLDRASPKDEELVGN